MKKRYYCRNWDCDAITMENFRLTIVSEKVLPRKFKFEGDSCPHNTFLTINLEDLKIGKIYNLIVGDPIRLDGLKLISKSIQDGPTKLRKNCNSRRFWTFQYESGEKVWIDYFFTVLTHNLEK